MTLPPFSVSAEASDLQKEYAIRFGEMAAYRQRVWKAILAGYLQEKIGADQTILDLGSGWGEFINHVEAREKFAMDLNPEGRLRVSSGVRFLEQDCSLPWGVPDAALDVVFTSNFFEHLPSKAALLATLREAHRCLRPGGRILCMGPNIKYVGNDYWDFFDHYLELSHVSLCEGLKLAGFEIASCIPRFLPYTMADGKRPPVALVRLYLALPLAWPFFGKQFLITARKPATPS